ncbi:hypothetical protein PVK06_042638 [Gossypium arboreum]|uniref:Uncharacterized protein n=1 Tax=Gossypium arboreum TaxID=29729 RepID=A0ABR0MND2_GOSAR|nr:hypothetical protein PVK06_042638 [Gossypium arboreum]
MPPTGSTFVHCGLEKSRQHVLFWSSVFRSPSHFKPGRSRLKRFCPITPRMLEEAKWSKPDVVKKGGGATKSCWRKASHGPGLRPTKEKRQGADFILVKE